MVQKPGSPFDDLIVVCNGRLNDVLATAKVIRACDAWGKKKPRDRKRLDAMLKKFSDWGTGGFSKDRFAFEERITVEHKSVAIFAFKPWQFRLYGIIRTVNLKTSFIATHADPAKKQTKAHRGNLERAAVLSLPYLK